MNTKIYSMLVGAALMGLTTTTQAQDDEQSTSIEYQPATVSEQKSFAEYKAVERALRPYIDAARSGDGNLSRTAFFDHAHIVGSINGEFKNSDLNTFVSGFSIEEPSPNVNHHIAWIDISGPAAAAKVEFTNWHGIRFTDFFVLYKEDELWKISGKVYDSHGNN